jgi:glucosamine-6-phosphate deaminase
VAVRVSIHKNEEKAARAAAAEAAAQLRQVIARQGRATFMAATGASQIEFLRVLTNEPGIDWSRTTMYHLDEYVGLPESHPASFRRYLSQRLINRVQPGTVHLIRGDAEDPEAECDRLGALLKEDQLDIAFVGIGENGHLAFNDPPADFETDTPFIVVELDDECRSQQVHDGWFGTLAEVPRRAITVTIRQILESECIVCTVPEARKAKAVKCTLEGPITPSCPASALRTHSDTHVFLDSGSASLLEDVSPGSFAVGVDGLLRRG